MNWINLIIISQCLTIVYCNFCSVDFKNQNLIYLKNGVLHYPEMVDQKAKLTWAVGDSGTIICNDNNWISAHKKSKIEFECKKVNGNGQRNSQVAYKLQYKGKAKDINPQILKCKDQIKFSVRNTDQKCESGTLLKVGVENNNLLIPFFDTCYDFNSGSVRYTKHVIAGKAKKIIKSEKNSCNGRKSYFYKYGLPLYTREGVPYNKDKHFNRFSDIVKSSTSSTKTFDEDSLFLARGHLTPVDDGVYSFWKRATMLYVNVAPEWQIINISNWKRVENIARTMAIALNDNLEVITGIADVLKMRNKKTKKDEELYLTTKEIQKKIIDERSKKKQKTLVTKRVIKKPLSRPVANARTPIKRGPLYSINKHSTKKPFRPAASVKLRAIQKKNLNRKRTQSNSPRRNSRTQHANQNGIEEETQENLIPVPKYYWKVLKYNNQYIAFITLNNPHAVTEKKVCTKDICKENGYPTVDTRDKTKGFHNFEGGLTYCCTIEELTKAFPTSVPSSFKTIKKANVLKYIGNNEVLKQEEETEKINCP